jgi:hypothetical protein
VAEKEIGMSLCSSTRILWTTTEAQPYLASITTESARVRDEWADRKKDLLKIRTYKADWDGFGADAPDRSLIDVAIEFLGVLRNSDPENPPKRVALSPAGAVAFDWPEPSVYTQAEIISCDRVEWMIVRDGKPTEWRIQSLHQPQLGEQQGGVWTNWKKIAASGDAVSHFVR